MAASKITFSGDYSELEKAIKSKVPDIKLTKVKDNVVIARCENLDDVHYFKNYPLKEGTKIEDINDINEDELRELSENSGSSTELQKSIYLNEHNLNNENNKDYYNNLANAIMNASLDSKTPIPEEDPINYVYSCKYLTFSTFAFAAFMFVGSLF